MIVKDCMGTECDIFSLSIQVGYDEVSDSEDSIYYFLIGKCHRSYFDVHEVVIECFKDLKKAIAYHRELKAALDAEEQEGSASGTSVLKEEVPFA